MPREERQKSPGTPVRRGLAGCMGQDPEGTRKEFRRAQRDRSLEVKANHRVDAEVGRVVFCVLSAGESRSSQTHSSLSNSVENNRDFAEGFPSGQRDQTVNLTAQPSKVRILPPPPDFA